MALIAPSLLSADFLHLEKDCRMLNESRADWFHLDVMDGHFVPNISFGPMIVDFIRKATPKYCDVHLMIEKPEKYLDVFRKSGADNISVHIEACPNLHDTLKRIRDLGSHAGIAINPGTPVEDLTPYLHEADLVCMMSVNPGFGGQAFIETTYEKIRTLKKMIRDAGANMKIEVDGGVGLQNAASIIEAGADVLVAGNSVFRAPDPKAAIAALKEI
jgi:ribulose-phosphate 3-epimerase